MYSFCTYWFIIDVNSVLDRTNIGNARLQGLPEDALNGDPTGTLFDWVTSAFFFSYVCIVFRILFILVFRDLP